MGAPKPLNQLIAKISRLVYHRRGFGQINILNDWAFIIGASYAASTTPVKLTFKPYSKINGTLYISTYGNTAMLLKHIEPEILERINGYFGYSAVGKIKYVQTGLPFKKSMKKSLYKNSTNHEKLSSKGIVKVQGIKDDKLRQSLETYGSLIALQKTS